MFKKQLNKLYDWSEEKGQSTFSNLESAYYPRYNRVYQLKFYVQPVFKTHVFDYSQGLLLNAKWLVLLRIASIPGG